MKLKKGMENKYRSWKAKNRHPYSSCCFLYAEAWANAMEEAMQNGNELKDCWKKLSYEVNERPEFGVTGFMYGMAVSILSHCWEHGELLRQYHNLDMQVGDEGEKANKKGTVLNPAILTIG
jgi:hypothetical protein